MGPLGPTVLNTPFFARSGVGYLGMKEIDASYLCNNRYALCKIRIDAQVYAQNQCGDVWKRLGPQGLVRAERSKSGLGLSFTWKDAYDF